MVLPRRELLLRASSSSRWATPTRGPPSRLYSTLNVIAQIMFIYSVNGNSIFFSASVNFVEKIALIIMAKANAPCKNMFLLSQAKIVCNSMIWNKKEHLLKMFTNVHFKAFPFSPLQYNECSNSEQRYFFEEKCFLVVPY